MDNKVKSVLEGIVAIGTIIAFVLLMINSVRAISVLNEAEDFIGIVISSIATNLLLTIMIMAILVYHYRKMSEHRENFQDNKSLIKQIESNQILTNSLTALMHTAQHYTRYLNIRLENNLKRTGNDEMDEINETFYSIPKYFITLLDNIKHVFDKLTGDDCGVCIKLVKKHNDRSFVKTYYRDSISYRKRKESDYISQNKIRTHEISDNTAFDLICSPLSTTKHFFCEDLESLSGYNNSSPNWRAHYNATIVTPIGAKLSIKNQNQYTVIGFLCIDNFLGNFRNKPSVEVSASLGDLLYNLIRKLDVFFTYCEEKNISHRELKHYVNWNLD